MQSNSSCRKAVLTGLNQLRIYLNCQLWRRGDSFLILNCCFILGVGRVVVLFNCFPDSSLEKLLRWKMNEIVEIATVRLG
jgi:hypothetical protein